MKNTLLLLCLILITSVSAQTENEPSKAFPYGQPHPDAPEQIYVPLHLTYSEVLKVSEERKAQVKNLHNGSSYFDEIQNDENEETSASSSDYKYWMRQSKDYNERLTKDPRNVDLWLEFVRFQDRAFGHLFDEDAEKKSSTGSGGGEKNLRATTRALAERKLALLDSAIKKNPHSIALQCNRLEVGELVWDVANLNKQWNTLIYNFPNDMTVWHR